MIHNIASPQKQVITSDDFCAKSHSDNAALKRRPRNGYPEKSTFTTSNVACCKISDKCRFGTSKPKAISEPVKEGQSTL